MARRGPVLAAKGLQLRPSSWAVALLTLVAVVGVGVWSPPAGGQPVAPRGGPAGGHLLYLTLPPDVSRESVVERGAPVRERLHGVVRDHLASRGEPAEAEAAVDRIVIFVDHAGVPILPDREATRGPAQSLAAVGTDLTFTFDSPTHPWSAAERATLEAAINDLYPAIKAVYGDPAFPITVNVRKDPTISFPGLYYPSLNEMVLSGIALDVLCHEMIHAFRDDNVIALTSYEEGMTRAAEIEVFNRLPGYAHPWDHGHSYTYDVYYEALNRPEIGALGGNFFLGYPAVLLRYQLAGYAWGKALLENPAFFVDFNREYYARVLIDPSVQSMESALLEIAAAAQFAVEGQSFPAWYAQQGVFGTTPPTGYFLYQRVNQLTVDYFRRDANGLEIMQANASVGWSVSDHAGSVLDSGSGRTTGLGWLSFIPVLPGGHTGRLGVTASASAPTGAVEDTTQVYACGGGVCSLPGGTLGVFGVVPAGNAGTVVITPLDDPTPPATATVVNGGFAAPELAGVRGRFLAVFTDGDGVRVSKQFTKDASDYFLLLVAGPAASVGGAAAGVAPTRVLCRNRTTGQRVAVLDGAAAWDCESAGLGATSNDTVQIGVQGVALGSSLAGLVTGVTPETVRCGNQTTQQEVVIRDGAKAWDCGAAGLAVQSGDAVDMRVLGTVD